MEGGVVDVACGPELRCYLQSPRQSGRGAEEFLVEPVAPAADGLRQGDAGGDGIGHRGQRDTEPPGSDPGAERTE